jgi:hypothetical protein
MVERIVFRHIANLPTNFVGFGENIEATHSRPARGGRHVAGKNAHRRTFAGAIATQQAHDLSATNLEGQVMQRPVAGIILNQVRYFNHQAVIHRRDGFSL